MLVPLAQHWKGGSALVSFKLETDSNILVSKARKALNKYGHKLVIGNILDTRKKEVSFFTVFLDKEIQCIHFQVLFVFNDELEEVKLSEEELNAGVEIEEKIITRLIQLLPQL